MALRFASMRQLVAAPRKRLFIVLGFTAFLALVAAVISVFSAKPSNDVYDLFVDEDDHQVHNGDEIKKDTSNNPSILKPYPSDLQSASKDLAESRNPFTAPNALGSVQGVPGPAISIKGFALSKDKSKPTVFLSVNQSQDLIYQIGQEVGNGYRIVSIEPPTKLVVISDGINRLNYVLKEF